MKSYLSASFWVVVYGPRGSKKKKLIEFAEKILLFGFVITLRTKDCVRFLELFQCTRVFHTKSGDPARTWRLAWNYLALRNTDIDWEITVLAWWILWKKIKALKKATYYVGEIEEKLNFGVTEDLRLAYERICDIHKALDCANGVKDTMLDADTSFDEVRK